METKYKYIAGGVAGLAVLYLLTRTASAAPPAPAPVPLPSGPGAPPGTPSAGVNMPALVGGPPLIVPVGTTLTAMNPSASAWVASGVFSSNTAILQPTGTQGQFVAVAPGIAAIVGTYSTGTMPMTGGPIPITDKVQVTVIAKP